MRRSLLIGLLALAPLAFAAPAGAAVSLSACPHQKAFKCGVLTVPLDRQGRIGGTVPIHFAVEATGPKPLLFALSGGPGQSAVSDATDFALALLPALDHYRIVVLDQRGTGKSGPLICPELQHASGIALPSPVNTAKCADEIGPRRAFYSTTDTVLDMDALRQALGAGKIAIAGVSYGTFVAQQYAQQFPNNVSALVLDSVVPTAGVDPFNLDIDARISRVLRSQCAGSRCRGITTDPAADVATLDRQLATGPLTGRIPDAHGNLVDASLPNAVLLTNMIVEGDLNPFLQPALPAAISSAIHGDPAALLRLVPIAEGGSTKTTDLSVGLNAATICEDSPFPYSVTQTPIADRPALISQALSAIAPTQLGPFDPLTVLADSDAEQCSQWPQDPAIDPISTAPLPNVPTLILSGQLDTRTPLENGEAVAEAIPDATAVVVPGVGHDPLDADLSGCVEIALAHFFGGRTIGDPCKGAPNQVAPFAKVPPLQKVRPLGATGTPGREVTAAYATTVDGLAQLLARALGGLTALQGGGLRAGSWSGSLRTGTVTLRGDSYVRGVRVSGHMRVVRGELVGTLHVNGPGHDDGDVTFAAKGRISGRIGGRRLHGSLTGARAARAGAPANELSAALPALQRWLARGESRVLAP
jgi:pimeloyl-ACP methyl ester carboxylesterase